MTIEQDEYIKKTFKELEKIKNDPQKHEEYIAREKAIRDYVTELMEAEERGEARGMARAVARAVAQGEAQGEEKIIRLYSILNQEGRMDDMNRCIKDKEYRKQLLEEYDLR